MPPYDPHANHNSEGFSFAVEQWSDDDLHLVEVIARTVNASVAQAAFAAACHARPKNRILLRNGALVLAKFEPGDPLPELVLRPSLRSGDTA